LHFITALSGEPVLTQGNLVVFDAHENWPFFAVDRNRVLRLAIWPPDGWAAFSKGSRVNTARKFEPASYFFLQVPAWLTLAVYLLLPATVLAQAQSGYLPEFGCQTPPFGLRLPMDLQGVMNLSPVKHVEILEIEKWEGYTTTRKYVHFQGLTLGLITFSNDRERYMVSRAEITDVRWAEISPFRVGEYTSTVQRKLGLPADSDPELKSSYGSEGGDLRFESTDRTITKIVYDCYTG
jgi:hypothetical protein